MSPVPGREPHLTFKSTMIPQFLLAGGLLYLIYYYMSYLKEDQLKYFRFQQAEEKVLQDISSDNVPKLEINKHFYWKEPNEDVFDHAFDPLPEYITWNTDIEKAMPDHTDPLIFFITPTYKRPSQMVDMIRLSQTLMHDKRIYWIVIEDSDSCTKRIRHILHRSGLLFAHINIPTPIEIKGVPNKPKGVVQRNRALDVVDQIDVDGVVYFGDDDNAYDIRLFPELRKTIGVSVFSVGFVGGGAYERCVVDEKSGKFWYFMTNWPEVREYSIDMGGFAFHTTILRNNVPRFRNDWPNGYLETKFIEQIVTNPEQLQPLLENCTRIYVWHVSTKGATLERVQSDPLFSKYKNLV